VLQCGPAASSFRGRLDSRAWNRQVVSPVCTAVIETCQGDNGEAVSGRRKWMVARKEE
jgi:hypothetical protein